MAAASAPSVYQLKVTLKDSDPPIWRRIQVRGNCNFHDLHMAIQATMEWRNYHMHQFRAKNPRTGVREVISRDDDDGNDFCVDSMFAFLRRGGSSKTLDERACLIKDYFPAPGSKAIYEYDMGDYWQHVVELEEVLPAEKGVRYPRCVAGENAGPPEDCGGIEGYHELKAIIANPRHKEHKEKMEWLRYMKWLGGDFNPAKFDPKAVKFT